MRLGLIRLGADTPSPSFLDDLLARDIDLIVSGTPRAPLTTLVEDVEEARRVSRADCDGIMIAVGKEGHRYIAAIAALMAGTPLLVYGLPDDFPDYFNAVGALEAAGVSFDRMPPAELANGAAIVYEWLRENAKTERHRGIEAARKLYGQRLYLDPAAPDSETVDANAWLNQFGVIVTTNPEWGEFSAGGDSCGALTLRLLSAIAREGETTRTIPIPPSLDTDSTEDGVPATFARINRRAGRYRCLLLRGTLRTDSDSLLRLECSLPRLLNKASSPLLHTVPGDHLGAIRAACEALDIEPVILRA